jgi:hypothetical protein
MDAFISRPCQSARQAPDMGDKGPCRRTRQVCFEVSSEPAASPEPGKRSLDNPTSRENFEALGGVGPFDNL